jgi:hypothetical protein
MLCVVVEQLADRGVEEDFEDFGQRLLVAQDPFGDAVVVALLAGNRARDRR